MAAKLSRETRVDPAVRDGYREAGRIVRGRAGNFHFAFLGQPAEGRRALHAIYAFCREADDAADDGRSPAAAREALASLRVRLHQIYGGRPELPRDRALQHAVLAFGIRRRDFEAVLRGVERDFSTRGYETFDELYPYCFEVAASVGLLCLPVFGRSDPEARRHAVDLGVGMQLTNILRDVPEDARRGRVYLPLADLRRFGVDEKILRDELPAGGRGRLGDRSRLDELIRFEARRARRFLEQGKGLLTLLDRGRGFCPEVLAGLYQELLDRIEKLGASVLERRVTLSTARKAWIAARTFFSCRLVPRL